MFDYRYGEATIVAFGICVVVPFVQQNARLVRMIANMEIMKMLKRIDTHKHICM